MPTQGKRIIAFGGQIGAGKSTLAHAMVAEDDQAIVIDIDDFKRGLVDRDKVTTEIDPPELRWQYYQAALEAAFDLLRDGMETVVMDEVFHLRDLRDKLEEMCRGQGVEVLWVEVRCPYELVRRRLSTQEREGHILSTAEALRLHRLFQDAFEAFPAHQPNHLVINNQASLAVSLRLVQEKLQTIAPC